MGLLLLACGLALPFYTWRFQLLSIPLTALEVIMLGSLAAWSVRLILKHKRPQLPSRWWLLGLGLLLASVVWAVLVSPQTQAALGIAKAYFFEPVLLFLMIYNLVTERVSRWRWIAVGLGLSLVGLSAIGLGQWLFQWPVVSAVELAQGRVSVIYNTANAVGLFLIPIMVLMVGLATQAYRRHDVLWTIGLCALVLASGLVVVLSHSAGALVGLTGACLVVSLVWLAGKFRLLTYGRWRWFVFLLMVGYLVAVGSYLAWFNHPPQVANPYTRPGFSTFTVRQCTWEGTIKGLKAHPVRGFGLAGFSSTYLHYATCDAEPLVYPHTMLLNVWTELGLVGVVAFWVLIGLWLMACGRLIYGRKYRWFGWVGLAVIAYWMIHGLVDVPYFKNDLSALWWAMAGLTVALAAQSDQIDDQK